PHRTTVPDKRAPCPLDKVNRQFRVPAPSMLWVSDFTYVSPPRKASPMLPSSLMPMPAGLSAGVSAPRPMPGSFRRPKKAMGLVHHSDRDSQYLSIKYTERLGEAGFEPSVGSVGDSYDNALAET